MRDPGNEVDLSITRKTEGNFRNVSAGVFVFQSRVSTKTVVYRCPRLFPGLSFFTPLGSTLQEWGEFKEWTLRIFFELATLRNS